MQVTLFAYSDLLLFTKEDEPGRCNVLRNPLYLQSVKLQEGKCGPEMSRTPLHCPESWVVRMSRLDPAPPTAGLPAVRGAFERVW